MDIKNLKERILENKYVIVYFVIIAAVVLTQFQYLPTRLTIVMKSSTIDSGQVFFDTGAGYNEAESYRFPIKQTDSFETYQIPIPHKNIRSIRLDPLTQEGEFAIKSIVFKNVLHDTSLNGELTSTSLICLNDLEFSIRDGVVYGRSKGIDPQFRLDGIRVQNRSPFYIQALFLILLYLIFQIVVRIVKASYRSNYCILIYCRKNPIIALAVTVLFLFLVLIMFGITGSSVGILYENQTFVTAHVRPLALSAQSIRSDEWLVSTPMAIGQMYHQPSLPVVNTNLGVEGQNMLIVGGAGMPVKHISALAKPATWGFHFLRLQNALAWYWWFPVFGCFFALWWLLGMIIPGKWSLAAGLSLVFCLSPYVVAWSYTPAYAVFFPSIALCSAMMLLRRNNWFSFVTYSVLLGLSSAGFILIIYPPWQVTLGYLYLALAIALVSRDRAAINIKMRNIVAFVVSLIITSLIIYAWWNDAKLAIDAIMNTVYPGQRQILTGGGMTLPELLRGFSNLGSLYRIDGGYSNQSEIASFSYLFLPLLAALFYRSRGSKTFFYTILPVGLFAAFSLFYMMYGVPHTVSRLMLWGYVPSVRADLALGLSYIFLCSLVLTNETKVNIRDLSKLVLAVFVSLIWILVLVYALSELPEGVLAGLSYYSIAFMLVLVFLCGVWLILGDRKKFIVVSVFMYALMTIPFNPLIIAPKNIELAGTVEGILRKNDEILPTYKRVLSLESQVPAMALLSAGIPTINGVLFYPQMSLWRKMGAGEDLSCIYNRYQHLIFAADAIDSISGYKIGSPQGDVVRVTVDAETFNFALTDAEVVVGLDKRLSYNESLLTLGQSEGWFWYEVIDVVLMEE